MFWFIKTFLIRHWYNFTKKSPADMEMISYWKTKESAAAKLTRAKDGSVIMGVPGEKYPITCFPRSYLLFGPLSKLKHDIKTKIFNETWHSLEAGKKPDEIIAHLRQDVFSDIFRQVEALKYDLIPTDKMNPAIREIHRAWTKIATSENSLKWRDILCLIIGDDDSYQFRLKFWAERFYRYRWFIRDPFKRIKRAFEIIEHAEVVGDMKERERLWCRGCLTLLEDSSIRTQFLRFCKEVNWKKLFLTDGDKYHLRAKYFKADYELFKDQW